jgi:hypothetical protein
MTVLEKKVFERLQCWKGKCSKNDSVGKESVRKRRSWKGKYPKDDSVGMDNVRKMSVLERSQCWKGKFSEMMVFERKLLERNCMKNYMKYALFK